MKKFLRAFALGLVIGGLPGLWLGINIGKDQPLFSNPFAESPAVERYRDKARQAVEEAQREVERAQRAAEEARREYERETD